MLLWGRRAFTRKTTTAPLPPGWYPDPSGAPGKRYFDGRDWTLFLADPPGAPRAPIAPWPSRRRVPTWAWVAIAAVVVVFVGVIVGDLLSGSRSQQGAPSSTTSSISAEPSSTQAPSGTPPRSQLIDMTLPRGSTPTGGQLAPGIEMWHVPLRIPDTVANLRPQLPINAPYDGLPWCAETIDPIGDITSWSWGTPQDLLLVEVGPFYPTIGVRGPDSQVTITRHPETHGVGCS
jgi:Protein of unknown function (DUF2510)